MFTFVLWKELTIIKGAEMNANFNNKQIEFLVYNIKDLELIKHEKNIEKMGECFKSFNDFR